MKPCRAVLSAALALTLAVPPVVAAPRFPERTITITARNQGIDQVLRDLFAQSGMRVKVSSAVTNKVNGVFTGSPGQIWVQLSAAFNIVAYDDGAVVRVYGADEIQTRNFASPAPGSVVRDAQRAGLIDANNRVVAQSNSVSATGVPAFLDRVAQLAASPAAVAVSTPVITPVTPATAPVISPLLGASDPAFAGVPLRSQIIARPTARSPYEVRIFYLRYARADDTIQTTFGRTATTPGVVSILRGIMGDGRPSSTVTTSGNFELSRQSQPRLLGRGLSSVPPAPGQADYDDVVGGGGSAVVVRDAGIRDVDGPRIEVDVANNAVVVRDRPESMKVYEDMIRAFDVEPRGVEIEATIIEIDTSRLKELGIDFNLQVDGWSALFGGRAQQPTENFSDPGIAVSNFTGALNGFAVRINALEKSGVLRVVSRPRLSTLNNLPAVFNNQVQYYVRVAGDRQVDLFPVTAGMELRATPSIVNDGGELRTRLAIEIVDGSPSGLVVDGIPAVKQSSINTSAVVRQGESLLIGGMTVETEYDFKSKVPVLGDIPIIGQLARKRSKGGRRLERLFLITPRILSQRDLKAVAAAPTAPPIPLERLEAIAGGKAIKRAKP